MPGCDQDLSPGFYQICTLIHLGVYKIWKGKLARDLAKALQNLIESHEYLEVFIASDYSLHNGNRVVCML